jgi:hypothetical protein
MKEIKLLFIRFTRFTPVLFLLLILLSNCSMFKPKFDPVGHQYAVTIKKEALALIDKAGESYSLHRDAVYLLMTRVERAYENARLKYKNDGITGIWDVMRSPEANRLARFMLDWEKADILDAAYREEAKKLLQENFDLLIKIEESKKK